MTNLSILTILHGKELGFVCLASCTTDVVVNTLVLFWLTRPGAASDEPTSHGGYGGTHGPGHDQRSTSKVIHLQRISAAPVLSGGIGSFNGTGSQGGITRPSTANKTNGGGGGHTNTLSDAENGRGMRVNFGGVYDGSTIVYDTKNGSSSTSAPTTPTATSFPTLPVRDPRRYSSAAPGNSRTEGARSPGFFHRIFGRNRSSDSGSSGPGRRRSEEDNGVRVTVTTRHDVDDLTYVISPPSAEDHSHP